MHERLVSQCGCGLRVRRLGGDRAGEIGLTRFLRNPAVTSEEMVSSAVRGTAGRCAGRHVLVIQDTTVVRSSGGGGDYLHAAVAVDAADEAILGLVEDQPLLEAFCATLEGKTERQKNPHPKGSLAYAAWVAARLGGWTGYYGKPGPSSCSTDGSTSKPQKPVQTS